MYNELNYLPVLINITDANILIVGGGKVATHKAQILSRFTHRATVVAPDISKELRQLPFTLIEEGFDERLLENVNLLFVCTGNHQLNSYIKQLAAQRGILTSVCDNPALCDFISPAIERRNNITIAVGSDSKDVHRSIRIRNRIKHLIEDGELQIE